MADEASDGVFGQAELDGVNLDGGSGEAAPAEGAGGGMVPGAGEVSEAAAGAAGLRDAGSDSSGRPFDEVAAAMAAAMESEGAGSEEASAADSQAPGASQASAFEIPELDSGPGPGEAGMHGIDLLRDVDLNVRIELGRSRMLVDDVLRLAAGSVVELDKLAGDPVDVLVNNRLVARGEVLVLNDSFCVRINDIISEREDQE